MDWVLLGSEHNVTVEYLHTFFPGGRRGMLGGSVSGWERSQSYSCWPEEGAVWLFLWSHSLLCTHLDKVSSPFLVLFHQGPGVTPFDYC